MLSYYFPIISLFSSYYVPSISLLFPYYFHIVSVLFPDYFPIISIFFSYYVPSISLLFPYYFPILFPYYSRRFATATARTASLGSHSRGMIQGRSGKWSEGVEAFVSGLKEDSFSKARSDLRLPGLLAVSKFGHRG